MISYDELKSFYSGRKVLVTGHTGFKGSVLTLILGMLGARVYGYALRTPTDPGLFGILYGRGAASRSDTNLKPQLPAQDRGARCAMECVEESHIADIRDLDELETFYARVQPEIVFHLAAQPIVRESYRIPRETYEINVMGTVNLLECIRLHPCCRSFLNVTTDKVYYNDEISGHAYNESDPLDGYDPYSNSKSCSELVTHSYACSFLTDSGTAVSTARAGNVIGGGDFAKDRIIPDFVRAVMSGKPLGVRNPYSVRPYQHVFEPLFAYLGIAMMQAVDITYSGWYNVGPDREDIVTTGELCDMFAEAYGPGALWEAEGSSGALHEAGLLILDNTRLRQIFGWEPLWGIHDAVKAAADWTRAWQQGCEAANEELIRQLNDYISLLG